MESKKDNSNSPLEHRRAQNRMAQRRFRQRQSQQRKGTTDQQPQIDADLGPQQDLAPVLTTEVFASPSDLSSVKTTNPSSTANNPTSTVSAFVVDCAHSRDTGLLGIQSFINMEGLDLSVSGLDSTSSSHLSAPSLDGYEEAGSLDHMFGGGGSGLEHRESSPRIPGSLPNLSSSSSSGYRSLPDSVTAGFPTPLIALSDDPAPAGSSSSSSLIDLGQGKRREPGTRWLSNLHIAAQKGHSRIVRLLLQHSMDCDEPDSDGLTPLIHATIDGHEDVVISLLSHGARIDKTDHQRRSALHHAVIHRRESLLKILLDHCMEDPRVVDSYDIGGRTALHTAVDMGFEPGVQALLQYGANLHSRARKKSEL